MRLRTKRMGLMAKRTALTLVVVFIGLVYAIGEEREISMFSEYEGGYLYNYGGKSYLGIRYKEEAGKVLALAKNREGAARISLKIVKEDTGPYGLLLSDAEKDREQCMPGRFEKYAGASSMFFGCPAVVASDRKYSGEMHLRRFDGSPMFRFTFSPVVLKKHHAFRIYHEKKCLTATSDGLLVAEECEDADLDTKSRQLFIWVRKDLFQGKINPLYAINDEKNPATPYYNPPDSANKVASRFSEYI